jgi:membrane-associated phospholipid phosphatase
VIVAVVGWARVRLAHHTFAQVAAGALAGGGSAWLILLLSGV